MTTVLLVDDHPIVRDGVRAILDGEPNLEIVGECGRGDDAVRMAAATLPDVVLMDLRLPGLDGVEATARITAAGSSAVLVLTTYDSDGDILRAVEAGALGYLLKDASRSEIVGAVRSAARGESVLAAPVAARLAARFITPRSVLTAREVEVLQRVADGMSNADIGRALYIGETTVKSHLVHIFDKLGVRDRTAAATTALARGILSPRRR